MEHFFMKNLILIMQQYRNNKGESMNKVKLKIFLNLKNFYELSFKIKEEKNPEWKRSLQEIARGVYLELNNLFLLHKPLWRELNAKFKDVKKKFGVEFHPNTPITKIGEKLKEMGYYYDKRTTLASATIRQTNTYGKGTVTKVVEATREEKKPSLEIKSDKISS